MPRPRRDNTPRNLTEYARRIRELRLNHDLTQAQVAKMLGFSQRVYADYELGNIRVPVEVLIELGKYYNLDMNYMCGLTDDKRGFPTENTI